MSFEATLVLATADGAFDERVGARVQVDVDGDLVLAVIGDQAGAERSGDWVPTLQTGESLTRLRYLVRWDETAARGEILGNVEGESATAAWDGDLPVLDFVVDF
ncbi:MAG: hypothetical protein KTR31_09340 [Myxococcales bacterium]|nr:hypothetical protein [Myxococcales bacterium]